MLRFKVEQIALCPKDPAAAIELLTALGAENWARDHVVASGQVFGVDGRNEADLAFNYDLVSGGKEFEVLHYTDGLNWMGEESRVNSVSHLGMHCNAEELEEFKAFFAGRGIAIAQEVFTDSHTNPVIAGKRKYNYVIFDCKEILGTDIKLIVRIDEA
jgi:4-hydroxyphenylpyruvate dioxygenase-like putative hemolysin